MTITPDGSTLFITQSTGVVLRSNNTFIPAASLFRIDINSNSSVTAIADPDNILGTASGLAVSPDGKTLYVSTDRDYIVALPVTADSVNSSNKVAEGSIPNDSHPGLAIDPAGNKLYVGNYTDGSVSILAVNGTQGYVEDTILTNQFTGASGLTISPDGATLYVAETQNDAVLAVSLNGSNQSLVQTGITSAFGLSLSLNGSTLYVTQSVDDINSTTVINTAAFLAPPSSIPIDGSSSTIGQFIGP
jgi:sugar lactone lactonase YvrE